MPTYSTLLAIRRLQITKRNLRNYPVKSYIIHKSNIRYFLGAVIVLLFVLSVIAWQTARDQVIQRGYEARFLTPDIDVYPWERRGEYPETITWTPEGIAFDPPAGSTAYIAMAARGTYWRPGLLPGLAVGPLGRLFGSPRYELTSVDVDAIVRLENAYFMIVEWGAITVQATTNGMLVTMIEPGLVYTNVPLLVDASVRQRVRLSRSLNQSCVLVAHESVCRETIPHKNDETVWIGESRKNSEHGGSMLLERVRVS